MTARGQRVLDRVVVPFRRIVAEVDRELTLPPGKVRAALADLMAAQSAVLESTTKVRR